MEYGIYSLQSKINFSTFDYMVVNYSVDMVRLNFIVHDYCLWDRLSNQIDVFRFCRKDFDCNIYFSSRLYSYKRLFVLKFNDSVIKIGCEFNTENALGMKKGFIEFNPNKVDVSMIIKLMHCIRRMCCFNDYDVPNIELSRWDLAIDIPLVRDEVLLYKDRKQYQVVHGKGTKTEYLGKRNTGGFVKLYDKTKESKLNETLTRLEITIDKTDLPVFPEVCLAPIQLDLSLGLNPTETVLVDLLNQLEESERVGYIRRLGRYMQKKIKPFCIGRDVLQYDYEIVNKLMTALLDLQHGVVTFVSDPVEPQKIKVEDDVILPFW